MATVRIICATPTGEPAACDLAETVDGAREWRRGQQESVADFGIRVLSESPRPAVIIMRPAP